MCPAHSSFCDDERRIGGNFQLRDESARLLLHDHGRRSGSHFLNGDWSLNVVAWPNIATLTTSVPSPICCANQCIHATSCFACAAASSSLSRAFSACRSRLQWIASFRVRWTSIRSISSAHSSLAISPTGFTPVIWPSQIFQRSSLLRSMQLATQMQPENCQVEIPPPYCFSNAFGTCSSLE